jgi:hypothetical protein
MDLRKRHEGDVKLIKIAEMCLHGDINDTEIIICDRK